MRVFVTGVTGQGGYYLARHVAAQGHQVHALARHPAAARAVFDGIAPEDHEIHEGDLCDRASLDRAIAAARPERIFHFAAGVSVSASWDDPVGYSDTNALGTARLLEAVRTHAPNSRFYYASSSEALGRSSSATEAFTEESPLRPTTPYGASKAFGHHLVGAFRNRYGMFAVRGIAFNHESPIGARQSVVQHAATTMVRIAAGRQAPVMDIGNLDAQRDWGFTGDYVEAMALMLEADEPRDYVIATGQPRTVRDLLEASAAAAGIAMPELRVAEERLRPGEVNRIVADPSRIRAELGWSAKQDLEGLMRIIVTDAGFRARALATSGNNAR